MLYKIFIWEDSFLKRYVKSSKKTKGGVTERKGASAHEQELKASRLFLVNVKSPGGGELSLSACPGGGE